MGQEYTRDVVVRSQAPFATEPWLFDDFESILVWTNTGAENVSAALSRITTDAYSGGACMLLDTGVTSPQDNDSIQAERSGVVGPNRFMEYIAFFRPVLNGSNQQIDFWALVRHSGEAWDFRFRINLQTGAFQYYDANEAYQNVTASSVTVSNVEWSVIRFAIDVVNGQYLYVILNGQRFDLNEAQAFTQGSTTADGLITDITLTTLTATRATLRVDQVIARSLDKV